MKKVFVIIICLFYISELYSVDFTTVQNARLEQSSNDPLDEYKDYYRLTSTGTYEKGALWFNNPINLNSPFIIEFKANFGNNPDGADGIAFVFHKDSRGTNSIGQTGICMGYAKGKVNGSYFGPINHSVALEFDTWFNDHELMDPQPTPPPNPPAKFTNDLVKDHFDIIRNGKMENSTITKYEFLELEDGKDQTIQIVWIPGDSPNENIGSLTVIHECDIIFEDANFEIDDEMAWGTGISNRLNNIYVGLTASTGSHLNYHRVKLILPELELKSEPLCGNIQLNADFPDFCGSLRYQWTNSNGTTDGLINPNTKNPVATKTGTYTCTVTEINSSYVWSAYIDAVYDEDISVNPNVPDFSFSKKYNNRLKFDNTLVSLNDGNCGSGLDNNCGYLSTSTSVLKLGQNYNNGIGIWLLKTDYFGEIEFSKYFVSTSGLDLNTLTLSQKEHYRFYTTLHNSINDYILKGTEGMTCTNKDLDLDLITPEKKNVGYFLSGETINYWSNRTEDGLDAEGENLLFMKVDRMGELINSIAIELPGFRSIALKSHQTEDDKYITFNAHTIDYPLTDPLIGSIIGLCYENGSDFNSFKVNKKFGFELNSSYTGNFSKSDFKPISIDEINPISKNYKTFVAIPKKDLSTNVYSISVLSLNDIFNSSVSNLISNQIHFGSYTDLFNVNILYNEKEPSNFYVVSNKQISKFDFNLNHIQTYNITYPNFTDGSIASSVIINSDLEDRIELLIRGSGLNSKMMLIRLKIDNGLSILNSVTYDYFPSPSFDNLIGINNGVTFIGEIEDFQGENDDLVLTTHNYNKLGCTSTEDVSISTTLPTFNTDVLISVVDLTLNTYDPEIVEIEHFPQDMGIHCIDIDLCTCEDLDKNSLEVYSIAKPREYDNDNCCFDVYIKNNSNCELVNYSYYATQSESGQEKDLLLSQTILNLLPGSSYNLGEICLADGKDKVDISVKIKKNGESSYCEDEFNVPLTFTTNVTCFEGCCDYVHVKFSPTDPDDDLCCWTPNITFSNPLCDLSDIEIKYYDEIGNEITLGSNGEICLEENVSHDITYKIFTNGQECVERSETLTCDECNCPDDYIKSTWLNVEADKDDPLCPAGKCAVTAKLEIDPEYASCFTHFNILFVLTDKDGNEVNSSDFMANQVSIPTGGMLPGVPPCIDAGQKLYVRVRLYSNGTTDEYCELNSPEIICDRNENLIRPEPCKVDNPLDEWSPEKIKRISLNGCDYIIKYVFRKTADGYQDVQIVSQEKVNKNCVETDTDEDVFRASLTEIIAEILTIRQDWEPKNNSLDNCSNIWRVVQRSCWVTFYGVDGDGEFTLKVPCESDCCSRQLRVCINEDGKVTVKDIGVSDGSSTFNCPAQTVPINLSPAELPSNTGCQDFACDIFTDYEGITDQPYDSRKDKLDNLTLPKRAINDRTINNSSLLLYQVFNNNELFRLVVQETKFETISIRVFNLEGNQLIETDFNEVINGSTLDIDISKLISGTYVVNILCGNDVNASHTIQVVR